MGVLMSKVNDKADSHEVWTVLPHHMGGGPHGLGNYVTVMSLKAV